MLRDKTKVNEILNDPNVLETICVHVANGGTLVGLAEVWGVVFGDVAGWIHADPLREKAYVKALNDRGEWGVEVLLRELRRIATFDIRMLFNEDGSVKPPGTWPDCVSAVVSSMEVTELFSGYGDKKAQVGVAKKIKLFDKMKALELLGKNMALFTDKHEVKVSAKLEDLVLGSQS